MNLFAIHFCNLLHDFHSLFSLAHGQKPPEEIFKLKEEYFKYISPAGFRHDHWSENHKSHLREKQPVENFPIPKSLHKPWLVHSGHSEGQGQANVSDEGPLTFFHVFNRCKETATKLGIKRSRRRQRKAHQECRGLWRMNWMQCPSWSWGKGDAYWSHKGSWRMMSRRSP